MTTLALQLGSVAALAGASGVAACIYSYIAPSSRWFLPVMTRADASVPAVALTFDDGPRPEGTGPILDILARHRVQAAFFVIGGNADRFPDLVRRMHDEGHLVCNHTYDHLPLGALRSPRFWREQLERTDETIERIIGLRPAFFRPPLGHKSPRMRAPLRASGHLPVCWSRRAFDGVATTPGRIVARIVPAARAGDIILLHDGREAWSQRDPAPTVAAVPRVIEGVRARGLSFLRLDQLIAREGYFATRTPTVSTIEESESLSSA